MNDVIVSLLVTANLLLTAVGMRRPRDTPARYAWWALADALGGVAMLGVHITWEAAAIFAFAAFWLWKWWKSYRRKRKKALRELGYKARARVADLVSKQREAWKPRPVLRPAPGGAR